MNDSQTGDGGLARPAYEEEEGDGALGTEVIVPADVLEEFALARAFIRQYRKMTVYDPARGWFSWTADAGWRSGGAALRAMNLIERTVDNPSRTDKAASAKWTTHGRVRAVLALAQEPLTRDGMVEPDGTIRNTWDERHSVVATQDGSGVLYLMSGVERPTTPRDLHLRRLGAAPRKPSGISGFDFPRLVVGWMGDDEKLARWLQTFVGYALLGDPVEQKFIVNEGDGGEGKSTFWNAIHDAAGSYGIVVPPATFAGTARDQDHPTVIARLAGPRIVIAFESPDGAPLRSDLLKTLTGGDRMAGRLMRQDYFSFRPVAVPFLIMNGLPPLKTVDAAIRRRVRVVHWRSPPAVPDPSLPEKIARYRGVVVSWMLDGARRYIQDGMTENPIVTEWTEDYLLGEDTVGRFLAEYAIVEPDATTTVAHVRERYVEFCKEERKRPASPRAFNARTEADLGVERKAVKTGGTVAKCWAGLRLM